jgi:hypothetical protein
MSLLPPFYLHTVAAIGIGDDPDKRSWIGTGFLIGILIETKEKTSEKAWRIWMVTNKHVLKDLKTIYIKFNSAVDPHSKDYEIALISRNGKPNWIGHPNLNTDVAVIAIPVRVLTQEHRLFGYFRTEEHISTKEDLQKAKITEGDRVFVLGFPMGLVDSSRQYVICRGGVIARVRDYLEGKSTDFLVDATVFPGNSGGPVILCPSAVAIQGTNPIKKADLIGVVKSYVPYADFAISNQTRKPRIMFEENSGLAAVEGVDAILDTVKLANKRIKARVAQYKYRIKKESSSVKTNTPSTDENPIIVPKQTPNPTRRK